MRQAIERFLIESTPASRCLLGIGAASPFMILVTVLVVLGLNSPEARPGLRTGVVWALLLTLLLCLTALFGIACRLWVRRHETMPCMRAEMAVALCIGVPFTLLNCLSGLYSAGPTLSLLGATAVGLLLLQWRVMLIGIAVCGVGLLTCDLLTAHDLVPYTSMVTPQAFVNGQPQWWWRRWQGLTLYTGLPITVTLTLMLFGSHDALRRRLALLAITDALTGLANRRHFMERLKQELARQRRTGGPVTVVSLDADHFKRINDQHGHAKGDEVLMALASVLSVGVRSPTDLVARLGGEEFALLLPDTSLSDAEVVCKRLQALLAARSFDSTAGAFVVTVSMGVAQCRGVDPAQVLREVDANLYQAKAAGRNRVVSTILEGSFDVRRPE